MKNWKPFIPYIIVYLITLFGLFGVGINACHGQSFELINQYPWVVTSIKYDGAGNEYISRQQGSLTKNGDTLKVFQVKFVNESGLIDFDFAPNGFFLHLTSPDNAQRIIEYDTTAGTLDTILTVPYLPLNATIHRGGSVIYSEIDSIPTLLASFGDGSISMSAQDIFDYRGKLIKINLNTMTSEVVLFGLRNPYRFDYDSEKIEGFITDVGNNVAEEVNYFKPEYSLLNLGWPCYENDSILIDPDSCGGYAFSFPEFAYSQPQPRAIIGGCFWEGNYYFTDHFSGWGGYLDSSWVFHEFPILFPAHVTSMTVNPVTNTLVVSTYEGNIYEYHEPPLSIDTVPEDEEPPYINYWLKKYGNVYITLDGKVLYEYPTFTGLYYSFLYKKWIFVE